MTVASQGQPLEDGMFGAVRAALDYCTLKGTPRRVAKAIFEEVFVAWYYAKLDKGGWSQVGRELCRHASGFMRLSGEEYIFDVGDPPRPERRPPLPIPQEALARLQKLEATNPSSYNVAMLTGQSSVVERTVVSPPTTKPAQNPSSEEITQLKQAAAQAKSALEAVERTLATQQSELTSQRGLFARLISRVEKLEQAPVPVFPTAKLNALEHENASLRSRLETVEGQLAELTTRLEAIVVAPVPTLVLVPEPEAEIVPLPPKLASYANELANHGAIEKRAGMHLIGGHSVDIFRLTRPTRSAAAVARSVCSNNGFIDKFEIKNEAVRAGWSVPERILYQLRNAWIKPTLTTQQIDAFLIAHGLTIKT